jgi:hypothetical protein
VTAWIKCAAIRGGKLLKRSSMIAEDQKVAVRGSTFKWRATPRRRFGSKQDTFKDPSGAHP